MKFSGYSIDEKLINALTSLGYVEPTKIQEATIVKALRGNSFIAKSETGSGKTHAYLIPSICSLHKDLNKVQVVIVEPTLELCNQVQKFGEQISSITKDFKILRHVTQKMSFNTEESLKPCV